MKIFNSFQAAAKYSFSNNGAVVAFVVENNDKEFRLHGTSAEKGSVQYLTCGSDRIVKKIKETVYTQII